MNVRCEHYEHFELKRLHEQYGGFKSKRMCVANITINQYEEYIFFNYLMAAKIQEHIYEKEKNNSISHDLDNWFIVS